jgi:hypothetical protein
LPAAELFPGSFLKDVLSLNRHVDPPGCFVEAFLFFGTHRRRLQVDCQFVQLAGKVERHLVVLVVHRRLGIDADVEGFVNRHEERNGVRDRLAVYLVAVNRENTASP